MKREDLIKSKGYWIGQFQIKLFETVREYLKRNEINQTEFADEIQVSKSYITQVLNGDFDHKISKYVELMIACGKAPILNTMELDEYAMDDACQFKHVLYTAVGKDVIVSEGKLQTIKNNEQLKEFGYSKSKERINERKLVALY